MLSKDKLNYRYFKSLNMLEKILALFIAFATFLLIIVMIIVPPLAFIFAIQIILGIITWRISGSLSPIVYKVLMLWDRKEKENYFIWDKYKKPKEDVFKKSLTSALLPTAILLFMLSYALRMVPLTEGDDGSLTFFSNPYAVVLFIFPAALTYFVVPVWVFLNSGLKRYDPKILEVVTVGKFMRIRMNSIGGVMAILIAIASMYSAYNDQVNAFIGNMMIILVFAYPAIFWTCYVYFSKYFDAHIEKLRSAIIDSGISQWDVLINKREYEKDDVYGYSDEKP